MMEICWVFHEIKQILITQVFYYSIIKDLNILSPHMIKNEKAKVNSRQNF